MVAKDIFPSATMTDGCKKFNFMEFFKKIYIFCETLQQKNVSKMPYSWENPVKLGSLQPLVTVAKDIFPFATVTESCKEANFMGCSHHIYENLLTSENMNLLMNFAKKGNFPSHSSK